MSENATKDDLVELGRPIEKSISIQLIKAVDNLSKVIGNFATQVDERFNKLEERMDKLEQSHQRLLSTVDGFIGRIDKYETELAVRDHQFERLLAWARKVSDKTGIPLENL